MKRLSLAVAVAVVLIPLVLAATSCKTQTIADAGIRKFGTLGLDLRNTDFRTRGLLPQARSIVRCRSEVEVVDVPEEAIAYNGVPLGGIVTIVETKEPLLDTEAVQKAVPACSGIFVSETQVISSAHCVFHQRRDRDDEAYWIYGDKRSEQTYLYAIAGRVSGEDEKFDVYALQRACIPESYRDAEDEATTSGQGNDIAVFSTEGFQGDISSIGMFDEKVAFDESREYMLPQYPSDVDSGTRLVIDSNTAAMERRRLHGGWFETIDLASWSGSSGGPIVDVGRSNEEGRPVIVAVLMSSGWTVCDSGIVSVTKDVAIVGELLEATKLGAGDEEDTGSGGDVEVPVDDGFVPLAPPIELLERRSRRSRAWFREARMIG